MCDGFKAVQAQRLSKRRAPGAPGGPSGGLEGEGGSGGNFSDEEKIELGLFGLKNRGLKKPSQLQGGLLAHQDYALAQKLGFGRCATCGAPLSPGD